MRLFTRSNGAASMSFKRDLLCGLTSGALMFHALCGHAQEEGKRQPNQTPQDLTSGEAKTIKERLGDKASDEQRVDNCKVPSDRRGPKIRPGCEGHDAGAASVQLPH
jgi:hypothetical protein